MTKACIFDRHCAFKPRWMLSASKHRSPRLERLAILKHSTQVDQLLFDAEAGPSGMLSHIGSCFRSSRWNFCISRSRPRTLGLANQASIRSQCSG